MADADNGVGAPAAAAAAASPSSVPPYGAKHMTQRLEARKHALKPANLEPKYPPVYPVFPRSAPVGVKAGALRVHPKGFRMLSKASPLERNMTTYFRLPPQPPRRQLEEQEHLKKQVDRELRRAGVGAGGQNGVVLDGFMMLEATGVQDPADAEHVSIADSNLVAAVADDLSYFVNLRTADFGENSLPLTDLLPLVGLETLHLHCNTLGSIAGLPPGSLPRLHTLNLSFNRIPAAQLAVLGNLPLLERLDLSCNAIGTLPKSFTKLRQLKQLALENNRLSKVSTFAVLGRLPLLEEVNLSYNKLATVPSMHRLQEEHDQQGAGTSGNNNDEAAGDDDPDVEDQQHGGPPPALFPKLAVLGLGANQFVYFEDLFNLSDLAALEQVVLWGNPIENRRKDAEILTYELGQRNIVVVFDSPLGRKKPLEFTNEHKVPAVDARGLPRGSKIRTTAQRHRESPTEASPPEAEPEGDDHVTSTFFMTENLATGAAGAASSASAAAAASSSPPPAQRQGSGVLGSRAASSTAAAAAAAANNDGDNAAMAALPHRATRLGRLGTAGSAASAAAQSRGGLSSAAALDGDQFDVERDDDDTDGFGGAGYPSNTGLTRSDMRLRELAEQYDAGFQSKRAGNIRSAMAELRNMLRQPLPPLNRPRFAGSKRQGGTRRGQQQQQADESPSSGDELDAAREL